MRFEFERTFDLPVEPLFRFFQNPECMRILRVRKREPSGTKVGPVDERLEVMLRQLYVTERFRQWSNAALAGVKLREHRDKPPRDGK